MANKPKKASPSEPHSVVDMAKQQRIAELEAELHVANRLYYDSPDDATLADSAFDHHYSELKSLAPDSPVLNERSNFDRDIQHTRLVGSLQKVHTAAEVVKHFGPKRPRMIYMPKIDGASLTLYYKDGILRLAATRGDSATGKGKDITANALLIKNIPRFIPVMGDVEVKGEAYIPKSEFYGIMDLPGYGGRADGLANPRNAAAGGIMAKNPYETEARKVSFIAYGLTGTEHTTLAAKLAHGLAMFGFTIPPYITSDVSEADEIQKLVEEIGATPADFETDGVVIALDDEAEFERMGVTGICPLGAIAYKFDTEKAQTQLLDIEWTALRTGKVRPRGRVKPVTLCGTTVEYLTLNNVTWLHKQDLCINDLIEIEKANEIIPKLVRVVARPRSRLSSDPTQCPSCESELVMEGADLMCRNKSCPAKATELVLHMLEKLDIKGIGPEFVQRMADAGLLSQPTDLFELTEDTLVKRAAFGPGQARVIVTAMSGVTATPAQQLAALGLNGWGVRLFTMLFRDSMIKYEDLIDPDMQVEVMHRRLAATPQIGPSRAATLAYGIHRMRPMLDAIIRHTKLAVPAVAKPAALNSSQLTPYAGRRICCTGAMSRTRGEMLAVIERAGAIAVDTVTKDTDFLVVGEKAGSKLAKANKLGIKVLTESEFWNMIKE